MSPYTIPDVVRMVILAGGEPVFYDFYPRSTSCDLDALERALSDQVACVIITHYHVVEPRTSEIASLCKAKEIALYDDCAIACGATLKGLPVGTLTDASIFSFSAFKMPNFIWGGLISIRDRGLAKRILAETGRWPRLATQDYLRAAPPILRYDLATRPALFQNIVFPLLVRRARRANTLAGFEHVRIETNELNRSITSRPGAQALSEWIGKLDRVPQWLEHRRSRSEIYRHHLGHLMLSSADPAVDFAGGGFTNFPLFCDAPHRTEIVRTMMMKGYDVGRSLYPNAHQHPAFRHFGGSSKNVQGVVDKALYLPTHFGVTDDYAHAIAGTLCDVLDKHRVRS